ncbi:MAG: hypothetical protein HY337_03915, partial [Gemmatimonadetes bacterium]|nr:hypothetical protein [Gemmatimonadota bacterium]
CLLMGGQACVLYGAAEFSRDVDLAILIDPDNLTQLERALAELQAERAAVPPFTGAYLARGHAVHFRANHPDAAGIRIDLMAVMRGVAAFPALWERRTTVETPDGDVLEVMALPDLVQAKKTQRDKDWPMIRRLLEADYFRHRTEPSPEHIDWWLRELRTPSLLIECAHAHRAEAVRLSTERALLASALAADEDDLVASLSGEEAAERARDREYWKSLRVELEALRREERRARG